LKCVGIDPQSHLLYQKAFLTSEIRDLLRQMQGRRTGGAAGGDASIEVSVMFCRRLQVVVSFLLLRYSSRRLHFAIRRLPQYKLPVRRRRELSWLPPRQPSSSPRVMTGA
jgi:hypothetical protein